MLIVKELSCTVELNVYLTGVMTTAAAWEETMVDFAAILKVKKL